MTDGLDWHNPEVTFEEVRSQAWVKVKYHSQVEIKQIVINNEWNKSNNSKVAGFVCLQVSCSSGDFGDWEGDCYCPGQGNWLTAAGFSTLCCITLCWFKLLYYIHANPTIGHFSLELFRCDSIDLQLPLSVSGSVSQWLIVSDLEIAIASPSFASLFTYKVVRNEPGVHEYEFRIMQDSSVTLQQINI